MTVIHVIEQHDQLLEIWRSQNAQAIKLVHLDFHCDMRGLLVDRQEQKAYPIKYLDKVDEGNFLTHAILERRIQSICWVHFIPGGRQYDVGTIMYSTDLSVQPLRWWLSLTGKEGIPLNYEVMEFSQWDGLKEGIFLNIDWDCFACSEYDQDTINTKVEAFFQCQLFPIPEQICLCYSPRYSHASRTQFQTFSQRLANLFQAEIVNYPLPIRPYVQPWDEQPFFRRTFGKMRYQLKHLHYEATLWLRQRNIY